MKIKRQYIVSPSVRLFLALSVLCACINLCQSFETISDKELSLFRTLSNKVNRLVALTKSSSADSKHKFHKSLCIENSKYCYNLVWLEKSIQTKSFYFNSILRHTERILDFTVLRNFNKYLASDEKRYKVNREFEYLVLIVTENSLKISTQDYIIVHTQNFNFNIVSADLSMFNEDNSICFLTTTNEVVAMSIDINIKINENTESDLKAKYEVDLFIPTRKTFLANLKGNEKIISLFQHKVHNNKYYVLSTDIGNIYNLHKDLDLRTSMSFEKSLTNTFAAQGIIGAMIEKTIQFINMLGGNTILLTCYNYNEFIDFYYDGAALFLYAIDRQGNFLVYNIKLSLSKQHANECYPIYTYKLKYFKSSAKIFADRNNLFIITDQGYIAIVDNTFIAEAKFFFVEEIILTRKVMNKQKSVNLETLKIVSNDGSYYLFLLSNDTVFTIEMKKSNLTHFPMNSGGSSVWEFISGLNIFVFYIIGIMIISLVIIYFKRRGQQEPWKKRPFEEDKDGPHDRPNARPQREDKKGLGKKAFKHE